MSAVTTNIGLIITDISERFSQLFKDLKANFTKLDEAYHVGAILFSKNPDWNPNDKLGGHWDRLHGTFLIGADDGKYVVGQTGGHETHNHLMPIGFDGKTIYGHLATSGPNEGNPMWGSVPYDKEYSVGDAVDWTRQNTWCRDAYTQTSDHMPPYLVVNIWVRTS